MPFWNCEVSSPLDYLLLIITAASWCYAGYCLIQLRYERRRPLPWWEPVPFGRTDLTAQGREYQRRLFLALLSGASALMLAVAFCATR